MKNFPIFISVIYVIQNLESKIHEILKNTSSQLMSQVRDHEIIVIDNASNDNSVKLLKKLSGPDGIPNLQVYALTNEVDKDMAVIIGLENSLGDFTLIVDPKTDDISILTEMLVNLKDEVDVILAKNKENKTHGYLYSIANYLFNLVFRFFNGINLPTSVIGCQLLNRRVVSFILQHSCPELAYRYLPVTAGCFHNSNAYKNRNCIICIWSTSKPYLFFLCCCYSVYKRRYC